MTRMMRAGTGPVGLLVVLTAGIVSACTGQVSGEARPDPAVTVASGPTSSAAVTTSTSASSSSGRQVLCALILPVTSSATRSVNDYLAVYNATKTPNSPELATAQQKALADLKPVPSRLRTLPGLSMLPSSDALSSEVPAIATAVESVLVAIPLQKAAPFNAATDEYNVHLDAIRSTCTS